MNFKELKDKYNPEGSELRNLQIRLLEMLSFMDTICKENNIKYWISSGTCLGAVRHKGFIPWDDDLDIEMFRSDYKKFCKIFKENRNYILQNHHTDPYYVAPYAKLRDKHSEITEFGQDLNYKYKGLYIDIFVIEKVPTILGSIYGYLNWKLLIYGSKSRKKIERLLFFTFKKLFYLSIPMARLLFSHIPYLNYKQTYGSGWAHFVRRKEDIFPLCKLNFEGHNFYAPGNWDSYLTKIYGDYMTLPNLEKIKPHSAYFKILR